MYIGSGNHITSTPLLYAFPVVLYVLLYTKFAAPVFIQNYQLLIMKEKQYSFIFVGTRIVDVKVSCFILYEYTRIYIITLCIFVVTHFYGRLCAFRYCLFS